MWSDHHQSVWSHMKKQNKLRLNPEELCLKTLQETSCKAPEKLCSHTHTHTHTLTHTHSHTQIQKNCVSRRFKKPPAKLLRTLLTTHHTHTHNTHIQKNCVSRRFKKPPAKLLRNSAHTHTHHTHTLHTRRTVSQDASRNLLQSSWETLLKSTEDKTCFKHKDAHNKCWFTLVNRS